MRNLSDREKAFENKYAHDAELRFKVEANRNKLLGLWAAEKLGKSPSEAEQYSKDVIASDFEKAGYGDVIDKISKDFISAKIDISRAEIEKQLHIYFDQAKEKMLGE